MRFLNLPLALVAAFWSGSDAARVISKGKPKLGPFQEVVYQGKLDKAAHAFRMGSRWQTRKLMIVKDTSKPQARFTLEYREKSRLPPTVFDICGSDMTVERSTDNGNGVFVVSVEGYKYPEYVWRVRQGNAMKSEAGANYWVTYINELIQQCPVGGGSGGQGNNRGGGTRAGTSPFDYPTSVDQRPKKPAAPWYTAAYKEVSPLQCHSKNLNEFISYHYRWFKHGQTHYVDDSTWDADALHKVAYAIKKAISKAKASVHPLAQKLKEVVGSDGLREFEEISCGDRGWDSEIMDDITDENAESVALEGMNRYLKSNLDTANDELQQTKTRNTELENQNKELQAQLDSLRQKISAGSVAVAAPQQNLPELTSKQNVDLAMLKKGQLTIDQIKAKLKRGTGFPPTPMPDNEIQDYISALETHLRGASAPAAPVADLPPLTSKQNVDLAMIKKGQTTIGQVTTKLKRGTGFPPQPMPENEIKSYIEAIEAHLDGGAKGAAAAPAVQLPELNGKQKIDLAMLKKSQTSLNAIRTKLKRGTGFPPVPMPDAEVDKYIADLEAHLNGGGAQPAAVALPALNSKQKIDLAMLLKGQMTLDKIQAKLMRGSGFPPTPMPKEEMDQYISALKAHMDSGASASGDSGDVAVAKEPAAVKTTTTTTTRQSFSSGARQGLRALEILVNGTPATQRPTSELVPGAATAMLDLDRDLFLKKAKSAPKKTEKADTTDDLPEYSFTWIGGRGFGWQIQITGIQKVVEQMNIGNYSELIERMLSGDPEIIGELDDTRPDPIARLTQFMDTITADELSTAANDGMMKLRESKPAAFAKQFSGVSGVSDFIYDLAQYHSKRPKNVVGCMSDRFIFKETLDESYANLASKETYYESGAPAKLVTLIDQAVSDQMALLYRVMSNEHSFVKKTATVQQEWKYVERNLRQKATAVDAKLKEIPEDRREAIVPMLYTMNMLIAGNQYTVGKRYQSEGDGKWSPHYLDMFLHFLKESKRKNGTKAYLHEINTLCTQTLSLGHFETSTEATGAQLSIVGTTLKNIDRCQRVTSKVAPRLIEEWNQLRQLSQNITRRLERLEENVFKAAGQVSQRLFPDANGKPDWPVIKTAARKYALEEMMAEDDSKSDKVYVPQSLFDDYSLRTGLYAFCSRVHEQKNMIDQFYSVGSEPPTE